MRTRQKTLNRREPVLVNDVDWKNIDPARLGVILGVLVLFLLSARLMVGV